MTRILILDDQPQIVRHLRRLLKDLGYDSAFLTSPDALQERLEDESFDLLLLDYHLGPVTAIDVLEKMKSFDGPNPPTLVMTGDHDENLLAKCLSAGAVDFITKPISKVILSSRVEASLDRARYLRLLENHRDELNRLVEEKTEELNQRNFELKRVNHAFQKFVPDVFAKHIWKQEEVSIGYYEEQTMSVMFLDVRGYTSISENLAPGDALSLLNSVFSEFETVLERHGAVIEKFMGDGILILFPHNGESESNPIECAIDLQQQLQTLNARRRQESHSSIHIGIGVNTGPVMMGALGMPSRFNSTVIGDAVNLASRIQSLTAKYHCQILISDSTYHQHGRANHFIRLLDQVRVKGKSKKVLLYEVFNTDPPEKVINKEASLPLLESFHKNFEHRKFQECVDTMKEMAERFPDDPVGIELLKRCSHFRRFPPDHTWDGAVHAGFNVSLRRQSRRIELQIPPENMSLKASKEFGGGPIEVSIVNVSREGLLLKTSDSFLHGLIKIELQLEHQGSSSLIEILGHSVWSKEGEEGWEHGIQIIFPTLRDEHLWLKHLDQLETNLSQGH